MTDYTGHVSQKCLLKLKSLLLLKSNAIFLTELHPAMASVTVTFKATTQTIVRLFHYISLHLFSLSHPFC